MTMVYILMRFSARGISPHCSLQLPGRLPVTKVKRQSCRWKWGSGSPQSVGSIGIPPLPQYRERARVLASALTDLAWRVWFSHSFSTCHDLQGSRCMGSARRWLGYNGGGGAWRSAFAAFDTLADAVHMQHISCREHLTVFTESLTRKVSGVFLSLVVKESSRI